MAPETDPSAVSISLFCIKYPVKSLFVSDLGIFEQDKNSIVRSSCGGCTCVMMTISCMYVHIYRLYTM